MKTWQRSMVATALLLAFCIATLALPPSAAAEENIIRGNSSGNLAGAGYYAQQGEWIYYSDPFRGDALSKAKLDGSEITPLTSAAARYINVSGDWVYFVNDGSEYNSIGDPSGICRVRTDGSDLETLIDSMARSLTLEGDWLYYYDYYSFYRMKLDGSQRETISYMNVMDVAYSEKRIGTECMFYDGYVYYTDALDPNRPKLVRVNGNDGEEELLKDNCTAYSLQVHDGKLYFHEPNKGVIYQCNLDGSAMKVVFRAPEPFDRTSFYSSEDGREIHFFQVMDGGSYVSLGDAFSTRLLRLDEDWKNPVVVTREDIYSFGEVDGRAVYTPLHSEITRNDRNGEVTIASGHNMYRSGTVIAEYDGWVYFAQRDASNPPAQERQNYFLYRMRTDGSQKTQLSPESFPGVGMQYAPDKDDIWVDIYNNRVYYPSDRIGIRSVTLDGQDPKTHLTHLTRGSICTILDGWVYYVTDDDDFMRVRVDGADVQLLQKDMNVFISGSSTHGVFHGEIQAMDEHGEPSDEFKRYTVTKKGAYFSTDSSYRNIISVSGEKVIYDDGKNLLIYDTESGEETVSPLNLKYIEGYYQEWFYLNDWLDTYGELEGVHRVRYDGSGQRKISDRDPFVLEADARHLYMIDFEDDPIKVYQLNFETEKELLLGEISQENTYNWIHSIVNGHLYVYQWRYGDIFSISFDQDAPEEFITSTVEWKYD